MLKTTLSPCIYESRQDRLVSLIRQGFVLNPWLMVVSLLMVITFASTLVGLIVDQRLITGVPDWIKPAKFAISFSIYGFTFL